MRATEVLIKMEEGKTGLILGDKATAAHGRAQRKSHGGSGLGLAAYCSPVPAGDVREGRECLSLMDVTTPDTCTYG